MIVAGRRATCFVLITALLTLLLSVHAQAKLARTTRAATPAASATPEVALREETVVTHHSAVIGGRAIAYTATAGTILLHDEKHQPTASVFYIAFTADGVAPGARRPLTFAYNGGPGGSSALMDIGGLGPRIVQTMNAAATPPAPYTMVDNPDSLLDVTDLVFIDAVGTGFSRIVGDGNAKDFYGVNQDARAFTQFIRVYLSRNNRWNSPKYLAGESYGTVRSAVVAKMLQDEGISLNGLIFTGTVLDYNTIIPQAGNDLPYALWLPSEAAVAEYYGKLPNQPADAGAFLQEVRTFATGPYLEALAKGSTLPAAQRDAIAQQLHAYTSLPIDYLLRSNLRVTPDRFRKELLIPEDRTIGRYDARFSEFDVEPASSSARVDPTGDATFSAFVATMNRYVHDDLEYKTDEKYEFLSGSVNGQWDWKTGLGWPATATNVSEYLRDAMTANPYLRVFVGCGLYDLATPFYAAEYTMQHLGLNAGLQSHITFAYYPSGHMVYLNPVAHDQLKRDLTAFYQ